MKNVVRIIALAKPLYRLIAIISFLIVCSALLELVSPLFSKIIVDDIVNTLQGTQKTPLSTIFGLTFAIFALQSLMTIITSSTNRLGDHFAGEYRKFLTSTFYEKVLTLPQRYFDTELSGKIVNQLNRGIVTMGMFINTATNFILPSFLQSVFTIAVMAYYSIPIAVLTFILFPVYMLLSQVSAKQWGKEEIVKNSYEDKIRGRIAEVIGNMKLVKGFNAQQIEYDTIMQTLDQSNAVYARQSNVFHFVDFLRTLSLVIIMTAVLGFLFVDTYNGKLSIGVMVLIFQLIVQARRPLFAMSFILTRIQEAESGSKEFFEILSLPGKEKFTMKEKITPIKNPIIAFHNVSFQYDNSKEILQNITLSLRHGEKIALVGHSGAGKTTIINLIMKLYESTAGNITLNDIPYSKLSYQSIRQAISLVFQENELFSSTVAENVSYGRKSTEKEIIGALEKAQAWDFVSQLPDGIHSQVGERGVRLSGGQKQRIQIARAILKNSPILILDEATSSLDARSEKEVQQALAAVMHDKMVIIIAHRFSTIQDVQRIIVIDKGSVVDSGSPQELAKRPGIYSELLRYQVEGNKKLLATFELY